MPAWPSSGNRFALGYYLAPLRGFPFGSLRSQVAEQLGLLFAESLISFRVFRVVRG